MSRTGRSRGALWGAAGALFAAGLAWASSASANTAPVAFDQTVVTAVGTAVTIKVNATDADGDTLLCSNVTSPSHGSVEVFDLQLHYQPHSTYHGTDIFTYRVTDGQTISNEATITVIIGSGSNLAPVANNDTATTRQNTAVNIDVLANDSDPDGNPVTVSSVAAGAHGTTAINADGTVRYTPAAGYAGVDSFSYTISDGQGGNDSASVQVTVTQNAAPTATAQSVTLAEDGTRALTLAGTDPEGDPLTFTVADNPGHGALSGTAPNLTYTPTANYSGPDSFTFTVSDGSSTSAPATVSITVTPVNDPPAASGQSVTLARNGALEIQLQATDPEGDALTYSVATAPTHGSLGAVTGDRVTYTPAADYVGPDSFTFIARDGQADSAPATVSLTVAAVAPLVSIGSAEARHGQTATLSIQGTSALAGVRSLSLSLTVTPPAGAPALQNPVFGLGAAVSGWTAQVDPLNPWHYTVSGTVAVPSPAELMTLAVTLPAGAPPSGEYVLEAQSLSLTDDQGQTIIDKGLVSPGRLTISACAKGDIDGDTLIDLSDVVWVLRMYVLNQAPASPCASAAADVNCDSLLDLSDVVFLLRRYVLQTPLPCQ